MKRLLSRLSWGGANLLRSAFETVMGAAKFLRFAFQIVILVDIAVAFAHD